LDSALLKKIYSHHSQRLLGGTTKFYVAITVATANERSGHTVMVQLIARAQSWGLMVFVGKTF